MRVRVAVAAAIALLVIPTLARAQSAAAPALTASGGWTGFVDEGLISHGAFGVGAEWLPTQNLSVGPELLYMVGPWDDRDLFLVGIARVGILPIRSRVAPFVMLGGGIMTHS